MNMRDFYKDLAAGAIDIVADDDILYFREGNSPFWIKGKFSTEGIGWDEDISMPTTDKDPRVYISAQSLDFEPRQGDQCVIDGIRYRMSDPDVDEYGVYEIELRYLGEVKK